MIFSELLLSQRYKIAELSNDWDGTAGNLATSSFCIKTQKPLGDDVHFITNDPSGLNPTLIQNGTRVIIYKYKVENKPRFDGRFFVKIYYDDVFKQNIDDAEEEIEVAPEGGGEMVMGCP